MPAERNGDLQNEEYVAEIVKMAAKAGADAAIQHLKQQREKDRKKRYDKRLHNTKLLLRNYRAFRNHIENAVFEEIEDAMDEFREIEELMWEPSITSEMIVDSILKNLARTKIIVDHTERMLRVYAEMCKGKPAEERHYGVIYDLYISDTFFPDLPFKERREECAKKYYIHPRTIGKDIDAACIVLSTLLFGIEGLN